MQLPDNWLIRPTTSDDADDLLALVHASDMVAVGFADFDPEDVAAGMGGPVSVVATGPGNEIMAWGYLENSADGPRDFLEVYVHPEGGEPARQPLLQLLAHEVAQRGKYARAAAIPGTEVAWTEALDAFGFKFVKQYARMAIDLPAPPTEPVPDVTVRPVTTDELPVFYGVIDTAFRDTPDYQHRSYERFRERWIDGHEVAWDEWLVAFVDGQLVGALQSSQKTSETGEGWVQNLAVLREFRKRGVGRALLTEAFRVYAEKGRPTAGLGVDLANPTEAIKLYTGVGMTPAYQANIYERR